MRDFNFLYPPFWFFDPIGKKKLRKFINSFSKSSKVIDMGSGARRLSGQMINIDLFKLEDVDILGDAHNIPLRNASVDGLVATGLMEYMKDPKKVVAEFYRILKKGGRIYVTCPFLMWDHSDSMVQDHWRFTRSGVRELFKDFNTLDMFDKGSAKAACDILVRFVGGVFSFGNRFLFVCLNLGLPWLLWPVKLLDLVIPKNKYRCLVAQSFTFIGEKS